MIKLFEEEKVQFYAYTYEEAYHLRGNKYIGEGQLSLFDCADAMIQQVEDKKAEALEKRKLKKEQQLLKQATAFDDGFTPINFFDYAKSLYMPNTLVVDHLPLVNGVLKTMKYPDYLAYEDLEAEGRLALVVASESFDISYHTKFSSYAYACIRNALIKKVSKECNFQNRQQRDLVGEDGVTSITDLLPDNGVQLADEIVMSVDMERALEYIREKYKKRPPILKGLEAMVLYASGWKFCDIASRWGMAENHLTAVVSRARGVFKGDVGLR